MLQAEKLAEQIIGKHIDIWKKILLVISCIVFLYTLYQGCLIQQVLYFDKLPPVMVETDINPDELVEEFQKQDSQNFAYMTPKMALAYGIERNGEYVETVRVYVVSDINGLTKREYTFWYYQMFVMSLSDSKTYVYHGKEKEEFLTSLSLTGFGESQNEYQTGLTFQGTILDSYVFYPIYEDSMKAETRVIRGWFQLHLEGY